MCPIKFCSLKAKGCNSDLDDENFSITNDDVIVAKLSNPEGFETSVCVMCTNGQQNITYDKWTVKQKGIKYSEIIYLKTKKNEIVDYDYTNGNLSVISTSVYYQNK